MSKGDLAVSIEDISPVKKKISFEIPWDETKKELEEITRLVGKTAKVKGFRPGKVPRPILEKQYGDYIKEETINSLVNRFYWQAVDDYKLTPLSRPEIEQEGIKNEMPFAFTATVEVEPVIEPVGYKGLKLKKKEIKATEEEISLRFKQLQEMYATMEEISEDRPTQKGDFVSISFAGSIDGKPRENLKADDYLLHLGSGHFIPGFEEQLIGMKKGEEKEVSVTFPTDYQNKELAGKEAVFQVILKAIKEKKLPPLDEDFVKNFDRYETFDDLRAAVIESIEAEKAKKVKSEQREAIVEKLLASNEVPTPQSLVDRQIMYMMMDTHRYWSMRGMDPREVSDIVLSMKDMYREEAEKLVKTFLLMKSIAAKEGISVTEEEKASYIRELAASRGMDYETYRERLKEEGMVEQLELDLLTNKVFAFIEENSEYIEPETEVKP